MRNRWFRSQRALDRERTRLVDQTATRLAELAADLKTTTGLRIGHDVRWAEPRSAAIIEKTLEVRADLILLESERSDYLIGLLSNTDWELIRRSPVDVWFAGDGGRPPTRVLAAVADNPGADGSGADLNKRVLGMSELIDAKLGTRTMIMSPDDGSAADEIRASAKDAGADLIVMGAASLTRLERLLQPVTAEPMLAGATCDVLFVRDRIGPGGLPSTSRPPVQGLPAIDVERALLDPDVVFDHSPDKLAGEERLSKAMRRRLLQVWEADLKAELVQTDEGGNGAVNEPASAGLLPAVQRALSSLDEAA